MKVIQTKVSSCTHCPYCQYDEYWDIAYCSKLEGVDGLTRLDVEIEDNVLILPNCPLPDAEEAKE